MLATPLVRAKLRPPAPVAHYVRRARLLDRLDEAVAAPLTLVVAPAGAGKTSLVAAWATEAAPPTAWLSLDDRDRDAAQVWRGVISALETVAPGCGERALTALRGPDTIESMRRIPLMTLAETLQDRRMLVVIVGWTALNVLLAQGAGAFIEAAGVAWEAHLGGFYAGLLLYGFFDRPPPPLAEPQGFVRDDAAGAE